MLFLRYNNVLDHFVRVWCGAHQLDLVMAHTYDKVLHKEFFLDLDGIGWVFSTTAELGGGDELEMPPGSSYEMVVYEQGHAMVQERSTSLAEILGVEEASI